MATSYGSWSGSTRIWFDYGYTVSGSTARVTIKAYMQLSGGLSSNGSWPANWWGSWGSGSNNVHRNFSGSTLVREWNGNVSLSFGSNTNVSYALSATNFHGSASHSFSFALPARPYLTPSPVTNVNAVRVNNGQGTVTWTRNATSNSAGRPYSGIRVDRWSEAGQTWNRVANLSGSATSYTDNSIYWDNRWRYRVQAVNSTGGSSWTYSNYFATDPRPPSAVLASRSNDNIVVSWTNEARYITGSTIYDNGVEVGSVSGTLSSFTHTAPSTAVSHTYTVRTQSDVLLSADSDPSNTVNLLAPPNAPTNLSSGKPTYAAEDSDDIVLSWIHNPTDSSDQTAVEVQKKVGTTWVTMSTYSTSEQSVAVSRSTLLVTGYVGSVEWRVRTRGEHASWSPYSSPSSFLIENKPLISISSPEPNEEITTSSITLDWTYEQAQSRPQSSFRVTVDSVGSNGIRLQVYNTTVFSSATSFEIPFTLKDGGSYEITLVATSSRSLSSDPESTLITVSYVQPGQPNATIEFDENTGAHNIDIENTNDPIPAVKNRVYRNVQQDPGWDDIVFDPEAPDGIRPITNLVPNPAMVSTGGTVEVRRNLWRYPMASRGLSPAWGSVGGVTIDLLPSENAVDITFPEELTSTENFRAGNVPEVRPSISEGEAVVIAWDVENRSNYPVELRSLAILYPDDGSSINWSFISEVFTLQANERRVVSHTTPVADRDGTLRCDLRSPSQTSSDKVPGGTVIRVHDGLTIEDPASFSGSTFSGGTESPDPDLTASWEGAEDASASVLTGQRVARIITPAVAQADEPYRGTGREPGEPEHYARFRLQTTSAIGIPLSDIRGTQGETYTLLVWIRSSTAISAIQIRVADNRTPHFPIPAGEWTQHRVTLVAGTGGVPNTTGIRIESGMGHQSGDTIDTAYAMLTPGEYTGAYGDGDMPGWQWDGAPNESTSSQIVPATTGAEWELVGEFGIDTVVSDFQGLTNGTTLYLIEAVSDIPSTSRTVVRAETSSYMLFVNYGESYGLAAVVPYNPEIKEDTNLIDQMVHFFDGRSNPVGVGGLASEYVLDVAGTLDPEGLRGSTPAEIISMGRTPGEKLYRDMDGRRVYCVISGVSANRESRGIRNVSYTVQEVDKL